MCGICAIAGCASSREKLAFMVDIQGHRGPDDRAVYVDPCGRVALGHNRLSIIDRSSAGRQPMSNNAGTLFLVLNGEIYNYVELRAELSQYDYQSRTDTEVLLAAYERWGEGCLDHFLGMFAFAIWDDRAQTLFAARDRFGVKPLYYSVLRDGTLALASEIKALHAMGVRCEADPVSWATYFTYGLYDHTGRTFWKDVSVLPPGHALRYRDGKVATWKWYDLSDRIEPGFDERPDAVVQEEYKALLEDSIRLRFRSDVPVGINLSGGLDSSVLLGIVHAVQGEDSDVTAFTAITGDEYYDELPWVRQVLQRTRHPHHICLLTPGEVPVLAAQVFAHEDEPFGGLPTLFYSKIFERARELGVTVLLDGNGLDEQWAGYDYYPALMGQESTSEPFTQTVQGSRSLAVRPECLTNEFRSLAETFSLPQAFPDALRDRQYRDVRTKIPRTLRFNDRISMMHGTELREPMLDHRLFELAFRQPASRTIRGGCSKWMLRQLAAELLPPNVVEAPKRPLQTPQREWLRGTLAAWAGAEIEQALAAFGGDWLDAEAVRREWTEYLKGGSDNSFYVWQWISLGMLRARQFQTPNVVANVAP